MSGNRPREILKWAETLLKSNKKFRDELHALVCKSLKEYSHEGEGGEDKSAGRELSKFLCQSRDVEFIGFTPNVMYIKKSGDKEDLKSLWVHPFATATLLYKHKRLPMLMMINPGIRFNETLVEEKGLFKINRDRFQMMGISG